MYCVIQTTTQSSKEASKLAKKLVKMGLAACVQINKVKSHYTWKGKLCSQSEFLLSIKSKMSLKSAIQRAIEENHPYEVPEIAVFKADFCGAYKEWVDGVLRA